MAKRKKGLDRALDRIEANVMGCKRKMRFPTKAMARQSISIRRKEQGATLYTYKCPACRGWHLTKQPPLPTTAIDSATPTGVESDPR